MAEPKVAAPVAPARERGGVKAMLSGNLRQYGMMIALVLLMLLFTVLTNGLFMQPRNITLLLVQNAYVLILAIGMVMVIIAGHIDLSVGSVCAFVGATVALSMAQWNLPWWMAILLGILVGILVGVWQGFWVAYVGIPAFIVTLAGMLLFRGLDLMILGAQSIPVPEAFQAIANGYLPEVGPYTNYHNLTLLLALLGVGAVIWLELRRRAGLKKHNMTLPSMVASVVKIVVLSTVIIVFSMLLASYKGIPVVGLILLGLGARSIGVYLATACSSLTLKERVFCMIAYTPKATVQAAMGAVALSFGLPHGEEVLAILITAPLGLIGIRVSGRYLLEAKF